MWATEYKKSLDAKDEEERNRPKFSFEKKFSERDEAKKIRDLQKDDGKDTWITGKTLASTQAAITTAAYIEKLGKNKVVKQLDDQVNQYDYKIAKARESGKGEPEIRDLAKKREAISVERDKAQKDVDFYGIVTSLGAAGTAATELALAFGLTEKQVKMSNVAAVGTYGAYLTASKILGEEIPDSAKKFGKELTGIAKTVAEGGEPSMMDYGRLSVRGRTLLKDTKNRTKEIFGKNDEEIQSESKKAEAASLQESFNKQTPLGEELKKSVDAFRKEGDAYAKYDDLLQAHNEEKGKLWEKKKGYNPASEEYQNMYKKHNAELFEWSKGKSEDEVSSIMRKHPYVGLVGSGASGGQATPVPEEQLKRMKKQQDNMYSSWTDSFSAFDKPGETAVALNRVSDVRKEAEKSKDYEKVYNANVVIDKLSKKLFDDIGLEKGMESIKTHRKLFNNNLDPEEFKQRVESNFAPRASTNSNMIVGGNSYNKELREQFGGELESIGEKARRGSEVQGSPNRITQMMLAYGAAGSPQKP
jgi:gas vesicle protein